MKPLILSFYRCLTPWVRGEKRADILSIVGINKKVERIKQFIQNEDMQVKDGDVRQAVIKFMEFKEVCREHRQ